MLAITIAFWVSVAALIYVYAGYPALAALVGLICRREVRKAPTTARMSLIIAAYNEERDITARLDNALALDYPPDLLEIIVASDGSTDATESIVAGYESERVRLLRLPRRGKIHALNAAVASARGEVLVFSDANSMYNQQALRKLAANFADPLVGGVAGRTLYTLAPKSESSSRGENLYWSYDTWIKRLETLSGSIVSAHGGMYAIRRHLYPALTDSAVTDDFAISTAVVEQGYRLVFEPEACSYEAAVPQASREFGRRVRLMTRGLRGLILRKRLFNPSKYGFYSVVLFSHKLLRRLLPFALAVAFGSSALLIESGPFYLVALWVQLLMYSLAAAGYVLRRTRIGRMKLLYVPFFYCLANAAAFIAVLKLVRGERIELWQPQRHESRT